MNTVIQPASWVRPRGYANAIVAQGKQLFLSGQVGWDPTNPKPTFPEGFVPQFEQALTNIVTLVREAGAQPENLVRLTIYVLDKNEYLDQLPEVGAVWRKVIGKHYPAMALLQVSGLVEPKARLEIEATAVF